MPNRLKGLLTGKSDRTLIQLFRYTLVGGLAFLVDFSALFLLTEYLGHHYLVANAIAFGLGLATNYSLSVLWVFDKRVLANKYAEFAIFVLLGLIGFSINEITLYVCTGLAGIHYLVAKVFATGVTYAWNFGSRKYLLFTEPAPAEIPERYEYEEAGALVGPVARCATE